MSDPLHPLEYARRVTEMSVDDLWLRYFALGGMSSALEIEAYLFRALIPAPHDHDVLAVALNERFAELGGDHPVPYADDSQ